MTPRLPDGNRGVSFIQHGLLGFHNGHILLIMSKDRYNSWDDDLDNGPNEASEDEDLWFMPPQEALEDDDLAPLPRAKKASLFPYAEWRAAEGELTSELAALAFDFGRLEERFSRMGEGARRRLALQEVSSLGWWMGDRIASDRLSLWMSLQIGATGDDAPAFARGGWAVRRLTSGAPPVGIDRATNFASLLGQGETVTPTERIMDACEALEPLATLHPFVQSVVLFHFWRSNDPSPARDIEAAVLASRLAGSIAGQGSFLPLSLAGFSGLTASGEPRKRLSAYLAGAHQAVLASLLRLDRLADWVAKAEASTANLSGRTPPLLVKLLADWPSVSAPMAEQATGASRAAVQRNLDILTERGLIRELTGQGRYRVWTCGID